ncbi:MAG: DUF4038 domain-containing protein [Armatimonadota bacterium]|nr:MAG: DUF4038 domain-containing protein [Armatimonadota bacterium]
MSPRGARYSAVWCLVMLACASVGLARPAEPEGLKVSDHGRFLVRSDGTPFFWLGDTAWELFHRLDLPDSERYLRDRAEKGFTVIQAVVLAEFGGLTVPNANGDLPLLDGDPTRPNERYFAHVDAVVEAAARLGLYVGMLPTWGDKWNVKWGAGPEIFTPENAAIYGEFLGRRYRDQPIIWILGGDRAPENERHLAIVRAMAAGLRRGDRGRHLLTYHPPGGRSSGQWFHGDDWLSFNMIQSGHHARNNPNHRMIATDYARTPPKPCLDGEPCYEQIPIQFKPALGRFDDLDVRKAAYWAVFAGAHGHTYGANGIFQFHLPSRPGEFGAVVPWQEALSFPGAGQMRHLRALMESRPFLTRIPDQTLVVPEAPRQGQLTHLIYTRAADGLAVLYVNGRPEATQRVPGGLGNWDAKLRLALANEFTQDRPWRGEYRLVAIYDRALAASEAATRFRAGPGASPQSALALYTFTEGEGSVVKDRSGVPAGLDLHISDPSAVAWLKGGGLEVRAPVLIASDVPARELTAAIARSGAITIEAWITPADDAQTGPARVVTLSRDTGWRNLTLGQQGDGYEVRLRTTETSANGLPGVATGGREVLHVQATRDATGSYAMLYMATGGQTVTVDSSKLSGKRLRAWWCDPRTGAATAAEGDFPVGGQLQFTSPSDGPDWVLVLDDAAKRYPPPGRR